jgi:hypothetical protein
MKYFRVKFGYGKDDFVSVDETELPTALRAQITGKIGSFKEGTIAGNNIMAIVPDYQRAMGWGRDYQLTGEDYAEIGGATQREYQNLLEETKYQVNQISAPESKRLQ